MISYQCHPGGHISHIGWGTNLTRHLWILCRCNPHNEEGIFPFLNGTDTGENFRFPSPFVFPFPCAPIMTDGKQGPCHK
eukprot:g47152.t1